MSRYHNILKLACEAPPERSARSSATQSPREGGGLEVMPAAVVGRGKWDEWDSSRARAVQARLSVADPLLDTETEDWSAAEQYRIARTKILQRLNRPFRLLVTSPSAGDGKTITALNLAVAMGMNGEGKTLLMDADLRAASVHEVLGLPRTPGLAEVLSGTAALQEAIVDVKQVPGLYVLPAGRAGVHPTELFDSMRWPALADVLRNHFSHVIIDCTPVDVVAEQELIAAVCDGVLAVIRPGHTERALLFPALTKLKPRLVGVLVNAEEDWLFWRKSAHHTYSYYRRKENARRPA